MKIVILSFLLFISLVTQAQEPFLIVDHSFKNDIKNPKEALILPTGEKGFTALFLKNNTGIAGYFYDENLTQIKSLISKKISKIHSEFLGYTYNKESIRLFYSNKSKNKLSIVFFDVTNNNSSVQEYTIDSKNSNYFTYFSDPNHFYMLNLIEGKSSFQLTKFDHSGQSNTIEIKTYTEEFKNDWLYENAGSKADNFKPYTYRVDHKYPFNDKGFTDGIKSYPSKNGFTITMNNSDDFTYVLEINTYNYTSSIQKLSNPIINETKKTKSNSFLVSNHLFQITVAKEGLKLDIRDIENGGEIIHSNFWTVNALLEKKNSEIRRSRFYFSRDQEKSNLKFLLKVIVNNEAGLYVYENETNYIVTIGNANLSYSNGYTDIHGTLTSNDVELSQMNFDLLFDKKFIHQNEQTPENIHAIIANFKKKIALPQASLLDKIEGFFIFGNYNVGNQKYYLYKFKK